MNKLILTLPLVLLASQLACEQRPVQCQAHGNFAALYTLVEGNGPCAEIPGDVLGVQTYYGFNDDGISQNYGDATIGLQSESLGNLAFGRADLTKLASLGKFSEEFASVTDFCYVPELSVSEHDLPEVEPLIDEETGEVLDPGAPATSVRYEWSDMRLYTREDAPGTQMSASLVYTEDGCSATYHVVGLNPPVFCGDANDRPDDTQCFATPDPDNGRPLGSGINPEFDTYCDPVLLLCMIPRNPPSLVGGASATVN